MILVAFFFHSFFYFACTQGSERGTEGSWRAVRETKRYSFALRELAGFLGRMSLHCENLAVELRESLRRVSCIGWSLVYSGIFLYVVSRILKGVSVVELLDDWWRSWKEKEGSQYCEGC